MSDTRDDRVAKSETPGLSRRAFLAISTITAAGFALSGGVLGRLAHAAENPPQGIKHMGSAEYKVFRRLMEVTLPAEGTDLADPRKLPVLETLDAALLGGMAPHVLAGLKEGIAFFEQGSVATHKKPFSELSDAEAIAFCDAWANGDIPPKRGLAMGLKKLVGLAYWSNPATWPPLGYDGPMTKRLGIPSLGNAPLPA